MKIIMIYDQIQSGTGTKDDKMVPLQGKKTAVGPAVMMEPFLKQIDGHVVGCLYCGTGTFEENPDDVSKKLCVMVKRMGADVVICGPCYNYVPYSKMAAKVAMDIHNLVKIPVLSAMSVEMEEYFNPIKDTIPVVKMPKKGGTGLNDALRNICRMAKALVNNEEVESTKKEVCY
ncbi:GrdB-related putative oxidoreductase [Erysipelotrichaceae bacterium HCN-30851]